MNTLNFDTLTSGDILLTTTRSGVEGYYFFGEDKNLWSVKAVENGDNPTATVVPLGLPSSDEYILTLTDGQPVLTATMGEEKIITPICISQYTPEEAANISLRRRLSAENELGKFITYSTYKDLSTFSVHGDIKKAYLTNYPYPHPSTHLNNIADARARMDAVKGAAVDAYQRINESDLSTIDKMLTLTREAVAAVHKHISEANIDYTPGKKLNITKSDNAYTYSSITRTVTFQEGATAQVRGELYLITRTTKARAWVTSYSTGEEVGYLTFTQNNGITLKLNDGETVHCGSRLKQIPASTKEAASAYLTLEETVVDLSANTYTRLSHLSGNIKSAAKSLDEANNHYRRFYTKEGMNAHIVNLNHIISNLETAKEEITTHSEMVLWTLDRLINSAYGE